MQEFRIRCSNHTFANAPQNFTFDIFLVSTVWLQSEVQSPREKTREKSNLGKQTKIYCMKSAKVSKEKINGFSEFLLYGLLHQH